jgi:uncharacterized protein YktA (UPF0223 family)
MEVNVFVNDVLQLAYSEEQIQKLVLNDVYKCFPEVIRTKEDEVVLEVVCQKYVDNILDDGEW